MIHLYENIPAILRQQHRWVAWGIRDASPKAPYNPESLLKGSGTPAKAGMSETWSSFESAVRCVERGLARGIGYEFSGDDAICGVDLDHVLDEHGRLTPQAQAIVDKLDSYTEISPSETGLHIFVTASGADITRHRKKDGFVEIYSEGRYFTVIGNVCSAVKPISDRTAQLQSVHDEYLLPPSLQKVTDIFMPVAVPSSFEQDRFLRMGLERDKVFAALWAGERRYGNESSDDQAFMNKLAYWCSVDPAAMLRAFMQSPYYAQKDDVHKKKCQRTDYLPNKPKMPATRSIRQHRPITTAGSRTGKEKGTLPDEKTSISLIVFSNGCYLDYYRV